MIDRDAILEFIEERKHLLLVGASVFLIVLAFVLGIMLIASGSAQDKKKLQMAAMKKAAFVPGELFYPLEPLPVPGVQLSRLPRSRWSADDAKRWYTVPDLVSMDKLRHAGESKIDALLESVP